MEIGKAVREIRIRGGMTQGKLAECSGLTRMSIFRIETGRQDPTMGAVNRLATALGVSMLDLVRKALEDEGEEGQQVKGRGKRGRERI